MLLTAPSSMPLEFVSSGEAEAPEGKADVIDVKGPNGFAAKLFLDKASHRPLMIAYRGVAPRMVVQTQRGGGPGPMPGTREPGRDAPPPPPPGEQVDINMFLDDYKSVDGIMLPHHITRSIGGEPNEEWTFKAIKVNPTFKPDTFAAK
jgi:hypothetical protein